MNTESLIVKTAGEGGAAALLSGESIVNIRVYRDDQQLGAYSLEQIQALLGEGFLVAGDLAWVDGSGAYRPVETLSGIVVGPGGLPAAGMNDRAGRRLAGRKVASRIQVEESHE